MSRFNKYDNIFDEHDDGADLGITADEEAASDDQGREEAAAPWPRRAMAYTSEESLLVDSSSAHASSTAVCAPTAVRGTPMCAASPTSTTRLFTTRGAAKWY